MGLTSKSTGLGALRAGSEDSKSAMIFPEDSLIVALAGNPNVGKSTVFNALTGLNQHTGNWTGKTVTTAAGTCRHKDKSYTLVDLPGTYSLLAHSREEEVARDFICCGANDRIPDAVLVVCDATSLERNLNLVLQCMEITRKVVVCVNLMDEAEKKGITVDIAGLQKRLGVPVAAVAARSGRGLENLMDQVASVCAFAPQNIKENALPPVVTYAPETERSVAQLLPSLEHLLQGRLDARWTAIRLLEGDSSLLETMEKYLHISLHTVLRQEIAAARTALTNLPDANMGLETGRKKEDGQDSGTETELLCTDPIDSWQGAQQRFLDDIVSRIIRQAEKIARQTVTYQDEARLLRDRKIDSVLTDRWLGVPIMLLLLAVVLWLTIVGANYPSAALSTALFWAGDQMRDGLIAISAPSWLTGVLIDGIYRVLAWVVAVMLPPMAIFFPLFTLLEDAGYLPRVAFNLDRHFSKAKACGKQALTMCMGFGCNAAGVIGCRIIDSPRERLIAILTNCFVPCNGRFPPPGLE